MWLAVIHKQLTISFYIFISLAVLLAKELAIIHHQAFTTKIALKLQLKLKWHVILKQH